ncbi:MAG: hypothetical protein IJQ39_06115 [Thermoguttaceae bacterium]|nr:hypothetical protein [Thermoguttaceae bacterium]
MENKKNFWEKLTPKQYLYLGYASLFISILSTILFLILNANLINMGRTGSYLKYVLVPFSLGWPLFFFCIRKFKSFSVDKETDIDINGKSYILYLRSFNDDFETNKPLVGADFNTEEEILVKSLKNLGMVVAIGRPSEPAPPLGAKRIYVSNDQWQDKVQELSADARLVVLRLGETEGLKWEWEFCLDTIEDISKLLLIVPASISSNQDYIDQLVLKIKKQRNDIRCGKLDFSRPLNIGTIGEILYIEKNEDNTYSIKQIRGISLWEAIKGPFVLYWKIFLNKRPNNREFYIGLCNLALFSKYLKLQIYLEPIVYKLNPSSFDEKVTNLCCSIFFRFFQVLFYLSTVIIILGVVLFLCSLIC